MPAYRYRAVQANGTIATGLRQAANETELAQHLIFSGLELIEARLKKQGNKSPRRKTLPLRTIAVFCTRMTDMLRAGVTFTDSLREIISNEENGIFRDTLTDILQDIHHGTRIAKAFAVYGSLFPPVFISLLQSGEISGDLTETFTQLTRYSESRARTAEQLQRALRYPLFLLTIALGVVSFMMVMVVPKVIDFLNTIDTQLPLVTRILIRTSALFANFWLQILLALPIISFFISMLRRNSSAAALAIDGLLLRLPLLGPVLRKLALARFAHSFAILFQSGIGIVSSLRSAKGTLANRALENILEGSISQVQAGQTLSSALSDLMPGFAIRMIRTGEHSGKMVKNLNDIAATYDREVNEVTERMIGSLEPVLTLLIGGILAWVVLAVLGPIYGSIGKITGGY